MSFVTLPVTQICRGLFAAISVLHVFVIIIFALRFLSRFRMRAALGWDDASATAAIVFSTTMFAFYTLLIRSGLGHPPSETIFNYTFNGKAYFATEVLYGLGIVCGRLGGGFLYLRVFADEKLQRHSKIFMVVSSTLVISVTIWDVLTCLPVSMNWDLNAKGKCGNRKAPYLTACIVGLLSDTVALTLPMPLIWRLQIERTKKINLQCLFAFGLSTVAIVSWRLALLYSSNISDARAQIIFTAMLEIDLVIACSSIPVVYPLFARHGSKRSSVNTPSLSSRVRAFRAVKKRDNRGLFNPLDDSFEDLNPNDIRLDTVITTTTAYTGEDAHHRTLEPKASSSSQPWD